MPASETTIYEKPLDTRLGELEEARNWSARAIAKLENHIRNSADKDLYRINPYRYAAEKGMETGEAIDLFIHASKVGLFDIDWALICPMCAAVVKSFRILKHIDNTYYCTLCELSKDTSLDDYVEVSFTVNPTVRPIPHHNPEAMTAWQFYNEVAFSPLRVEGRDMSFMDMVQGFVKGAEFVPPGKTVRMPCEIGPGFIKGYDHCTQSAFTIAVGGEPASGVQTVTIPVSDGALRVPVTEIRPGKAEFVVVNAESKMAWDPLESTCRHASLSIL